MSQSTGGAGRAAGELWPELPLSAWQSTFATLQLWTQIIGKIKLRLSPFLNEWWNVTLFISARGLTTGSIPSNSGVFEILFDFIDHQLVIQTSSGARRTIALRPRSVANFYGELMATLAALEITVEINTIPDEVPLPVAERTPFERDNEHADYDAVNVERWWSIALQTGKVLERYRSGFFGKSSPVQFFWGSFDLSQTRFSGRPAPPPAGANRMMRLSEDAENVAAGFWPGGGKFDAPAFYSYTYPEPAGVREAAVKPDAASFDDEAGLFVLHHDALRAAPSPEAMLLEFYQSAYEAGAKASGWDRALLEREIPVLRPVRRH